MTKRHNEDDQDDSKYELRGPANKRKRKSTEDPAALETKSVIITRSRRKNLLKVVFTPAKPVSSARTAAFFSLRALKDKKSKRRRMNRDAGKPHFQRELEFTIDEHIDPKSHTQPTSDNGPDIIAIKNPMQPQ